MKIPQTTLEDFFILEEFERILDFKQNNAIEMFHENGVSYNKFFNKLNKNYINMPNRINTMIMEGKLKEAYLYCSSAEGFFKMLGLSSMGGLSGVIAAKIKAKDLSDLHEYTDLLEALLHYIVFNTSLPLAAVAD